MPSVTPKFVSASKPSTASGKVTESLAEAVCSHALALVMDVWGGRGNPKYDYLDQRMVELGDYALDGDPDQLDATRMMADIVELHENGVTEALIDWCEHDMGWEVDPERLALRFFPSARTERVVKSKVYVNEARDGLLYWLCNLRVQKSRGLLWKTGENEPIEPALATMIYLKWPLNEKVPLDISEKALRPIARRIDPEFADGLSDDIKALLPSLGFNKSATEKRPPHDDPEVEVALTQMLRIDLNDTVESADGQAVLNGVLRHPPILPDHAAFRRLIAEAKTQGKITDERADHFETSFKRAAAAASDAFKRSKAKQLITKQKFAAKIYTEVLSAAIV